MYSKCRKLLLESNKLYRDDIMSKIQDLNSELNSWDYGVLINGKVITDSKSIDWSKYTTIPIRYIKQYHVGICWDFVNYQHSIFKEMGVSDKSYLVVMSKDDNENDIVTHTFSIINISGNQYWFESSWFKCQGVHKITSYKDVLNKLITVYDKYENHEIYMYNPTGLDNNLSSREFFQKTTRNLIYSNNKR